jgi:hypothetical protein
MTRKIRFADAASRLPRRQPLPCGRRVRAPEGAQESYSLGSWWRVVGLCFFVVVALFGVATCRGARRAKHKAREKALADLLSLMEEADEASRLDMQDLERNVAWIRGAGGLERLAIVRAVMPDGELAAAMACPSAEQTDGKEAAPSPSPSRDLADGFETTRLSRYKLPSFDIVDEMPHDPSLGIEADDLWALRQLRRSPHNRRRLEAALANLSARDPRGMALDEIRMAALALRRARDHRELTARLQIINRAGAGEVPRRASVEMAEMV